MKIKKGKSILKEVFEVFKFGIIEVICICIFKICVCMIVLGVILGFS